MMIRTYKALMELPDFRKRYEFLRLNSSPGERTFGGRRYLNQAFYASKEWQSIRNKVILRDNGCDLALPDRPIHSRIIVHHIEPIRYEDIVNYTDRLVSLDNLICVSLSTHNAIHYGSFDMIDDTYIPRCPGDTTLWKEGLCLDLKKLM